MFNVCLFFCRKSKIDSNQTSLIQKDVRRMCIEIYKIHSDVHYHISLYLFEPLTSHRILFLFYALLSEPVVALF